MSGNRPSVAIVGAGWSGLAAAVELVEHGHPVTVIEAAAEPGGRARRVFLDRSPLDNGQHLLLGAYGATLGLLAQIGIAEGEVLARRPFNLTLTGRGQRFRIGIGPGGGALGMAAGLARCEGLSPRHRLRALVMAPRLRRPPDTAIDAEQWLARAGQPEALRAVLWRPLCLAALNVPTERACAHVFSRVLREAFDRPGRSDLLIPRTDLGSVFPRPAAQWLKRRGAALHWQRRVRALTATDHGWRVHTRDHVVEADRVVLAGDARATARLLPADTRSDATRTRLHRLGSEPITTVYVHYPEPVALAEPMQGRLDAPAQWWFDRALTGHNGVIAAVISGRGDHQTWSREALAKAVERQLAAAHPHWPPASAVDVVREKRATFACTPGSERLRPSVRGPLPGLWLAGDHVDTGLPATLEGAVRAGLACARALIQTKETASD